MNLYVFGEGKTEERLMKKLMPHIAPGLRMDFTQSGGKGQLVKAIIARLGPELMQSIRCVVLVDRDNGDTIDSIRRRYEAGFQGLLDERSFTSTVSFRLLDGQANILALGLNPPDSPDLRVALHVAKTPDSLQGHGFNRHPVIQGIQRILPPALLRPGLIHQGRPCRRLCRLHEPLETFGGGQVIQQRLPLV